MKANKKWVSPFRHLFNVLILAVLALALAACGSGSSNTSSGTTPENNAPPAVNTAPQPADNQKENKAEPELPKEVKIGFQVIPNAELLAKTLGLVEDKFPDTKIHWVQFDSGRDVNTAIASGSIDLGLAGSVPVAIGIANGLPYQVYFLHDLIGDNEALAVRKETGISGVKELEGKKVAVPFGSTTHFSLLSALQAEGIDPGAVTILDLQPPDILAAWQRMDIDAAFVWHPTLAKIVELDGQVITSAKKLSEQGIITADVGIVHEAFAKQYPEFLRQYVAILDEAVALYRDKPKEAARTLAPVLLASEEEALTQMNKLVWLTSREQREQKFLGSGTNSGFGKVLKDTGDFLLKQKTIQSSPELSVYENSIHTDALQP